MELEEKEFFFNMVGNMESRGKCRLTSLCARMEREKLVRVTGVEEVVIYSAKLN
jgi:hypothetical protein